MVGLKLADRKLHGLSLGAMDRADLAFWRLTLGRMAAAASFGLSGVCLLILSFGSSAEGYEISVYSAYPWPFWLCLCLAIVGGLLALALHVPEPDLKAREQLIIIVSIALPTLLLLLLPYFRGYYLLGRADPLTHLGSAGDILRLDHIGEQNFYPVTHLWLVSIVSVAGVDVRQAAIAFPALLFAVYVAGVFLLARQLGRTNAQVLVIGGLCVLPIQTVYGALLFPTYTAMCLLPFVLAVYVRRFSPGIRSVEARLVLITLIFFFPYTHILGALLVAVLLVSFELAVWWRDRLVSRSRRPVARSSGEGLSFAPALIVLVASLTWVSSFWIFRDAVSKTYQWFWEGIGTPPVAGISLSIEKAGLSVAQVIELLIRSNGQHVIYAMLFVVAGVSVVKRLTDRRSSPPPAAAIALTAGIIVMAAIYLATLVGDFTFTGQGERFLQWLMLATAVLCGLVFGEEMTVRSDVMNERFDAGANIGRRNMILVMLTASMVVSGILGVFNLHNSTLILRANEQVTFQDMVGMEHLFEFTKAGQPVLSVEQLPYRSLGALHGIYAMQAEQAYRFHRPPRHFGYDQVGSLGEWAEWYEGDASIAITSLTRSLYTELWPEIGWVTKDDLARLASDPTVSKVYANGEFELWYVSAVSRQN